MIHDGGLRLALKIRLEEQPFAVLSTHGHAGTPHATIVCFVTADDLHSLVFVTPRSTRKFALLRERPEAALFVDDRTLDVSDLKDIYGIEARGPVRELAPDEIPAYRELFLRKYPDLTDFADATGSAWCLLEVDSYDVVHRFQEVLRYSPGSGS